MPHLTRAFRCIAAAGFCAALAAQPVAAADLWGPDYREGSIKDAPPVYVFSWTGFYIGGHAGLMTGKTEGTPNFGCADADCALAEAFFLTDYDMDGGLFGGNSATTTSLVAASSVLKRRIPARPSREVAHPGS